MRLHPGRQKIDHIRVLAADRHGKFVNRIKTGDDIQLPLDNFASAAAFPAACKQQDSCQQDHRRLPAFIYV
ncbi:hypothetical protein D1872_344130 [compost metagenome]